ncbi:MAG TPA: hypothetical protein VN612_09955 [Acidobacteriaceae bacterium]|nr:hypothetical protein [Acidobacteriaceae bacterium]
MAGLIAALASSCLAQQAAWKAEPQDGLLVAPHAANVQYVSRPNLPYQQLKYVMQERYPASRVWQSLCHEMANRGWQAEVGCSNTDQWSQLPYSSRGTSRTSYLRLMSFEKENREVVDYTLGYAAADGAAYLQTLHVDAIHRFAKPALTLPQVTDGPATATAHATAEPSKIDFGVVTLGSVSPLRKLTYTFRERTEVQDITVQTSGEERLDFADTGTGSCHGSRTYKAGDTCTLTITFSPRAAAVRHGFALLQEASGPNVMTELVGTGTSESGQTAGPMPAARIIIQANDRISAMIPDSPPELGQPLRIALKLTDPHVIGISELQGQGDHNYSNISSGSAVGSGEAKIVADTGLTKTLEIIPLGVGKLKLAFIVLFADGGIAQKAYTLDVAPGSKGLKSFFLNNGSHALAIVLEDNPQGRQTWLSPQVSYRQLEYPIYLEDSSHISFTVLQSVEKPVIAVDPNGLVHGLRPGRATLVGDFGGAKDQVIVTVSTKENAPLGYRTVRH